MKKSTLAILEKTDTRWGAFALDYPGTGGLGQTLEATRQSLRGELGTFWETPKQQTGILTQPPCTSIDFSEFDPDHTGHYVIEWLTIDVAIASEAVAA